MSVWLVIGAASRGVDSRSNAETWVTTLSRAGINCEGPGI